MGSVTMSIHPSAVVETCHVADDVEIGALCAIGPDVVIGPGTRIQPHVTLMGDVQLGARVEVCAGAVVGRPPSSSPALSRGPLAASTVRIGDGTTIGSQAVIYAGVDVGADSLVGDAASIRERTVVGARCVIGRFVSVHPECNVGDGTRVLDHTHLATGTTIGRDSFLGQHVATASDNALGRLEYDAARVLGPQLGNDVSVGANATILPRIVIGDGATVGGGSVVTKDVAPGTTVAGVPARAREPSAGK